MTEKEGGLATLVLPAVEKENTTMPTMPYSSSTATARLERVLQQQLEELHTIVSATVTASSSSFLSASFSSAALLPVEDLAAAHDDDGSHASPSPAAFHKNDEDGHACLALCSSPLSSSVTSPSRSFSSSSTSDDEAFYHLASLPTTNTTIGTTALEVHLSSIQQLLLDSDFYLQQRIFSLWKQKSWHAVRLHRRIRVAFDLLKQRALHTKPRISMAKRHANFLSQGLFFEKAWRRLVQIDYRKALSMHGQRATLQRRARQFIHMLTRRVTCRCKGQLITLQRQFHLLHTSIYVWHNTKKCQQHLLRQENKLLIRCFLRWQGSIYTERASLEALTINLRARRAISAMVKEHNRLKSRANAALNLMAVRRMRRSLGQLWVMGCRRRRTMRLRDEWAFTIFYQTLAKRGMWALQRYLQAWREERQAWGLAMELEARNLARKTLKGWLHAAGRQAREMEELSQEGGEKRMRRRQAGAFQQLRLYAQYRHLAKVLHGVVLLRKARRRLEEWKSCARERSKRRDLVIQRQQQRYRSLVLDFFFRWIRYHLLHLASQRVHTLNYSKLARQVLQTFYRALHISRSAQVIACRRRAKSQRKCLQWWTAAAMHFQKRRRLYMARGLRRWRLAVAQQRLQRGIETGLGGKARRRTIGRRGLAALLKWAETRRLGERRIIAASEQRRRAEERRCRTALREWREGSKERYHWQCLEEYAGDWAQRRGKAVGLFAFTKCHGRRMLDGDTRKMAEYFHRQRRLHWGLMVLQRLRLSAVVLPAYRERAIRRWCLHREWGRLVVGHTRCVGDRQRQEQTALLAEGQWETRRLIIAVGQLERARILTRRVEEVQQHMHSQLVLQSLHMWTRETQIAQGLRRFQRRSQEWLLAGVMRAWGRWTAQQSVRRAALIEVSQKARRAEYFHAWRGSIHQRKELQMRAREVMQLVEEGLLQRAWMFGWRVAYEDVCRERRSERLFLRYRGWEPWRRWVREKKKEIKRVETVQSLMATRLFRLSLEEWGEAFRLARREEEAVQIMVERRAVQVLRRWDTRSVRLRQQKICDAYHLAHYFGYWRRYAGRAKRHEVWVERIQAWGAARPTMVRALASLCPSAQKQLAWQAWMAWYGLRIQAREVRKYGEVHRARGQGLMSVRRLRELVLTRKEKRAREEFNEGLAEHFRKAKGFCRLKDRLWEERRERRLIRRREMEARSERDRRECLEEAFGRWSVYTTTMQQAMAWFHSLPREGEREDKDGRIRRRRSISISSSSSAGGGESGFGKDEHGDFLLPETGDSFDWTSNVVV